MSRLEGLLWTSVPEFGRRLAGRDYPARPGAYAVLPDAAGRIAVVATPEGVFLPGGGAGPGETLEQALHREVAEECALALHDLRPLGRAIEYVRVASEDRCFAKDGLFFRAVAVPRGDRPVEADHVLLWLETADALARLTHESQVWVVRQALG
jgi:8-oxo-dGTP diphosphatase